MKFYDLYITRQVEIEPWSKQFKFGRLCDVNVISLTIGRLFISRINSSEF